MNFAPYQDASPDTTRAFSPPLRSPTHSPRPSGPGIGRNIGTSALAPPSPQQPQRTQNNNGYFAHNAGAAGRYSEDVERGGGGGGGGVGVGWSNSPDGSGGSSPGRFRTRFGSLGGREEVDLFETRLGIRMDWEACLAYLLLPPAGGVLLLVLEHRSDYVRFHAWQSALLFSFMFVMHVIFAWTSIISWLLFILDLILIGYLTMRAYRDAETLDRCEVPFFGPLASSILDDE